MKNRVIIFFAFLFSGPVDAATLQWECPSGANLKFEVQKKTMTQGCEVNGQKHGVYSVHDHKGNVLEMSYYENGKVASTLDLKCPQGGFPQIEQAGGITQSCFLAKGSSFIREGPTHTWNIQAVLIEKGQYLNDKKNGTFTLWYTNGKKWHERNYKNDVVEGLSTEWDMSGVVKEKLNFVNGKATADQAGATPPPSVLSRVWQSYQKLRDAKKVTKDGRTTSYDESGKPFYEVYRAAEISSRAKFFSNGKKSEEKTFDKNGKLLKIQTWNDQGGQSFLIEYVAGVKTAETQFHPDGKTVFVKHSFAPNGSITKKEIFQTDGKISAVETPTKKISFFKTGEVQRESVLEQDHWKTKIFDKAGGLLAEENHLGPKKDGEFINYYPHSTTKAIYKNDFLIESSSISKDKGQSRSPSKSH